MKNIKNKEDLSNDLTNASFSGLFFIDINDFNIYKDKYKFSTVDQILKEMEVFLINFSKNRSYDLYYIQENSFVLRNKASTVLFPVVEKDIEDIFKEIKDYKIKIEQYDALDIDITIGISLEKNDALKKAQKALFYAKKNNMKFIAYSKLVEGVNIC